MGDQIVSGIIAGIVAGGILLVIALLTPKQACAHCGYKFAKFLSKCPKCGTKRQPI